MEHITSRKNPKVLHMKKLGVSGDYRRECGEFLCDGAKLLDEAVKNGAVITAVFFCTEVCPIAVPDNVPQYSVTREIIEAISPMKTPQDVLFSCKTQIKSPESVECGRFVLLDGIQDPGNVGTIIRTANAFGFDGVILGEKCADIYNPKTVRATMGAIFRQNIIYADLEGIRTIKNAGIKLYGAALHENSRDIRGIDYSNSAIVVGSEGKGITPAVLELCDETVIIPMMSECESLNAAVAASVIMWESRRDNFC